MREIDRVEAKSSPVEKDPAPPVPDVGSHAVSQPQAEIPSLQVGGQQRQIPPSPRRLNDAAHSKAPAKHKKKKALREKTKTPKEKKKKKNTPTEHWPPRLKARACRTVGPDVPTVDSAQNLSRSGEGGDNSHWMQTQMQGRPVTASDAVKRYRGCSPS